MRKAGLILFSFLTFLTGGCYTYVANSPAYQVRGGLRERNYDNSRENTLAFWLNSTKEDWDKVEAVYVMSGRRILYKKRDLNDAVCVDGKNAAEFFQFPANFSGLGTDELRLVIERSDGQRYVYDDLDLIKMSGAPRIKQFETAVREIYSPRLHLDFEELESGFDYELQVYGENGMRVYTEEINGDSADLNIGQFAGGNYLIGIDKCDKKNRLNYVSREYTVKIMNGRQTNV